MLFLLVVFIFVVIVASTWFLGMWNNVITLINVIIAATVSSILFEPIADMIDGGTSSYTYVLDFVALWGVFFVTMGVLRGLTDTLSSYRMKFALPLEMIGRTVFAILIAWVFICFTTFTLHTAPLSDTAWGGGFQATPQTRNLGVGPDRMWLAYLQSRSLGALSEYRDSWFWGRYQEELHPDDESNNCRVFDSRSDFIYKYHHRRRILGEQQTIAVNR